LNVIITQPESGWLDLSGFQDVVAFLDVREVLAQTSGGSGVSFSYQTAPTPDDSLFTQSGTSGTVSGATLVVTQMLKDTATVPLARWLRWQIAPVGGTGGPWDVTFRIWIAASRIGPMRLSPATMARVPPPTPSQPIAPGPTTGACSDPSCMGGWVAPYGPPSTTPPGATASVTGSAVMGVRPQSSSSGTYQTINMRAPFGGLYTWNPPR
jgi:hypothetical protein